MPKLTNLDNEVSELRGHDARPRIFLLAIVTFVLIKPHLGSFSCERINRGVHTVSKILGVHIHILRVGIFFLIRRGRLEAFEDRLSSLIVSELISQ